MRNRGGHLRGPPTLSTVNHSRPASSRGHSRNGSNQRSACKAADVYRCYQAAHAIQMPAKVRAEAERNDHSDAAVSTLPALRDHKNRLSSVFGG